MLIRLGELQERLRAQETLINTEKEKLQKFIERTYIRNIKDKAERNWFFRTFTDWQHRIDLAFLYCNYGKNPEYIDLQRIGLQLNALRTEFLYISDDKISKNTIIRLTNNEASVLTFKV